MIVDDGYLLTINQGKNKIKAWTFGECPNDKILLLGYCKCPQFAQ